MIKGFQGEHRWLSNFWFAELNLLHVKQGVAFKARTNEHAYQAMKAKYEEDFYNILSLETPGQAKRAGKLIKIDPHFEEMKLEIMYRINLAKYTQHEYLKTKLLATSGLIEETNLWGDTFWGVCRGVGNNELGKILMKIREELKTVT
jgi:ribA/ribD-fused uncharacterized protein